jgi:hypothetical protein
MFCVAVNEEIKAFKNVVCLKCLETYITNQAYIDKEVKSRLNSVNACWPSVQNLLSPIRKPKDIQNYNFISCFI